MEQTSWNIIGKYFRDNKYCLVKHHLEPYNDFYKNGLRQIFKEKNPIRIIKEKNHETKEFTLHCNLYIGGKSGSKIYFGKPMIYDENKTHYMYPNDARMRNMTYGMTIHYDVDIEYKIIDKDNQVRNIESELKQVYLGRFPIMLHSDFCLFKGLESNVIFNMGECKNDKGGYFIIDGKEKVIVSQEKFANNMLYIREQNNDFYSFSAEIRSVSEDASKPQRTLAVKISKPHNDFPNNQIVVVIPNVRSPIPLFILMRALGVISDKQICETIFLDIEENEEKLDTLIPSIHHSGNIYNQKTALEFISTFIKHKTIPNVLEILSDYFLPHIGELNFKEKAYYLGYIVNKLLRVANGEEKPTDRDSFRYKRVETPGTLIYDLFREYYNLQQKNIYQKIDKEYYYRKSQYLDNFESLIELNKQAFFQDRIVEEGFRKAYKGNWGANEHTKRFGVVQDLNRLSYNSYISHLRKINLPMDSSAKVVAPRLLHGSQWGIIDPLDTPDGGNIGFHKHMSIATHITKTCSIIPMLEWIKNNINLKLLGSVNNKILYNTTKIFVNGKWIGIVEEPILEMDKFKYAKRTGIISTFISINWNIRENAINIFTDGGRLCRPIFYINHVTHKPSFDDEIIREKLAGDYKWEDLILGFNDNNKININDCINDISMEKPRNQGIIEYIDTSEAETLLIAIYDTDLEKNSRYTNIEIHPSLLLGVMGNLIVFPENNQLPRDLFSCGQSKQGISLYHSNYQTRIDKMGVVLNYGQVPLIKSRYFDYINNEEHPYGENVIVAIASYGGYNVEDAIIFNEASVKRGLFRITYLNSYESREETSKVKNSVVDSYFSDLSDPNILGVKPGYDYNDLNEYGLIKENTLLDDKKIIIGKIKTNLAEPTLKLDSSTYPKKGQLGYVDKVFITEGETGFRIAKVRIREERFPAIGDKFCSRCGQKGTCGIIMPEEDMPFSESGIRPDIIINPHALPSRMTIGQLVESLMGKATLEYGAFGDCTAFVNKGPKNQLFGEMLTDVGFHSSGNEVLYNGLTGEQIYSEIFMGPTYYMRLKQMVKDKINYRTLGPRTNLTRQTVQGRANDGGLRIGEMERDGIIAHGATKFLQDSLMNRGDEYKMAICNKSGAIAIFNKSQNLFMSLFADGPIKFNKTVDDKYNIEKLTKYGRSFSVVNVPYAFKLLLQELQGMNVQMRIITSDNLNQLDGLSYNSINFEENKIMKGGNKPVENIKKEDIETELKILDNVRELDNRREDMINEYVNDEDDEDDEDDLSSEESEEEYKPKLQIGGDIEMEGWSELNLPEKDKVNEIINLINNDKINFENNGEVIQEDSKPSDNTGPIPNNEPTNDIFPKQSEPVETKLDFLITDDQKEANLEKQQKEQELLNNINNVQPIDGINLNNNNETNNNNTNNDTNTNNNNQPQLQPIKTEQLPNIQPVENKINNLDDLENTKNLIIKKV
jgi:DNA-directed RNA polymerase II subunit RPB2